MNFIVTDASLWVARFVPRDKFHPTVKSWLDTLRTQGDQFLAPAFLLPEVGGAISRRTGDPALSKQILFSLENLPGLRIVEMDNALLRMAANLAADLALRGADSIYVAVAVRLSVPLATLDIEQKKRSAGKVEIISFESGD
jgi:predicted nucleic acid-binding protein